MTAVTEISDDRIKHALDTMVLFMYPINFDVAKKIKELEEPKPSPLPPESRSKKYIFNGAEYGIGRIVLTIIMEYMKKNKNVTLDELQKIFSGELQRCKKYKFFKADNIVEEYPEAERINKDSKKERFFMKDAISLNNGKKVVVCREWGKDNIDQFITKAEKLGFKINNL